MRPLASSGAAATALNPSRSIWARRSGANHTCGSVRMLAVVTTRPSSTARLMGPPATGMRPREAYSALSRPTARSTRNSGAWPSQDTTRADWAPITSIALPAMVSRTSLRSSEETRERPMVSMARSRSARRRSSVVSVRKAASAAGRPSWTSGRQRLSIHRGPSAPRGSSAVVRTSPLRASRNWSSRPTASSNGARPRTGRPRAALRVTPVRRSIAAFQCTIRRSGSAISRAAVMPSRRSATGSAGPGAPVSAGLMVRA